MLGQKRDRKESMEIAKPVYRFLGSIALLAAFLLLSLTLVQPAQAHKLKLTGQELSSMQKNYAAHAAVAHIVINTPPSIVWSSIREQRLKEPDVKSVKVVEKTGDAATMEERMVFPTLFGTSNCLLHVVETPMERVDFKLIESNNIKEMQGAMVLTPATDGQTTTLTLISYVEVAIPVPHIFVNSMIQKKIERRIAAIKVIAEGPQKMNIAKN